MINIMIQEVKLIHNLINEDLFDKLDIFIKKK